MIEWLSKKNPFYSKDVDVVIRVGMAKKYKSPFIVFKFKRLSDEIITCDRKVKISRVTEDNKVYFCQGDKDDYTISNRNVIIASTDAYKEFGNYCGEYVLNCDKDGYYVNVERH